MGIMEDIAARLERIEAHLTGPALAASAGMVDQHHTDLGRRVHCAAVRRRRAEGDLEGALIVRNGSAKRYLLSPTAYASELQRACLTPRAPEPAEAPADDPYHRAIAKARGASARKRT